MRVGLLLGLLVLAGCTPEEPTLAYQSSALGGGLVARVAETPIMPVEVASVMSAKGVDARSALDFIANDALLAIAARDRLPPARIEAVERGALARALIERIWAKARATPVSDAELAEWTARKWYELDRPPAARTVHFVALATEPEQDAAARAVAERVREAVRHATDEEDFKRRAREVPHPDVEVRVENVDATTADGRVVSSSHRSLDPAYSHAAVALRRVGEVSAVVKSEYGYHVIMLLERLPGLHLSAGERRKRVRDDVFEARAHKLLDEQLAVLTRPPPVIERSAGELLMRVRVSQ